MPIIVWLHNAAVAAVAAACVTWKVVRVAERTMNSQLNRLGEGPKINGNWSMPVPNLFVMAVRSHLVLQSCTHPPAQQWN